jgi:hypothetical protein
LQSVIHKCRIFGTEGETIKHIISSCTVLAQSEYKKRHDIFAKIIHMNVAVKFNLLKDTQPHYSYTPESCLENNNYKLYFDRTVRMYNFWNGGEFDILHKKFGNLPVRYMRTKLDNEEEFKMLEKVVKQYKFNLVDEDLEEMHRLQTTTKKLYLEEPSQMSGENDDVWEDKVDSETQNLNGAASPDGQVFM